MYNINELIELASAEHIPEAYEVDCSVVVQIAGKTLRAYTASISHRDILLYCDKGTVTLVIDLYGDVPKTELFDYELDEE